MKRISKRKKRPCSVCRRWFSPDPRLGERQRTCGSPPCKKEWHRRKCAEWNTENREYFQSNYLQKKLEEVEEKQTSAKDINGRARVVKCRLPLGVVQEVISKQEIVIIEYLIQVWFRRFQEVMRKQVIGNTG